MLLAPVVSKVEKYFLSLRFPLEFNNHYIHYDEKIFTHFRSAVYVCTGGLGAKHFGGGMARGLGNDADHLVKLECPSFRLHNGTLVW